MFYSGGILTADRCPNTNLDHAITAVGWGTDKGSDYLIVRNSWGTGWGEKGYIRMEFDTEDKKTFTGACGVLLEPSQPETN